MGPKHSHMRIDGQHLGDVPDLPNGHVRSRDTLYVVSKVLAAQADDTRRKDNEITELRSEFLKISEAHARVSEMLREKEHMLEREHKNTLKLRKELSKRDDLILKMTKEQSAGLTQLPYKSVEDLCGSPFISKENSLDLDDILSKTMGEDTSSSDTDDEDCEMGAMGGNLEWANTEMCNQNKIMVQRLQNCLRVLRNTWEDIWAARENSGEDPHNPQYDDDLPTYEKLQEAIRIQRDIGRLNKQLIVDKQSERLSAVKEQLLHGDRQSYLRNISRKSRVNFDSPHARSVEVSMTRIVMDLMTRLVGIDDRFVGKLLGVGSYGDRTKLGNADELDFLYVLTHPELRNLRVKPVGPDMYEVMPSLTTAAQNWTDLLHDDKLEIYVYFARLAEEIMNDMRLPPGVTHAGIDAPRFSGLRKNRPAVTFHFCYRGMSVFVDITVALFAPPEISSEVFRRLSLHVQHRIGCTTAVSKKLPNTQMIMVVQAGGFGQWKTTTSVFEAHLMKSFRFNGQLPALITLLKYINDKLLSIHPPDITSYLKSRCCDIQDELVESLCNQSLLSLMNKLWQRQDHENLILSFLSLRDMTHANTRYRWKVQTEWKDKLLARPTSLQSYIHPSLQRLAGEKPLSLVSSSSCIFKYMVLGMYARGKLQYMAEDSLTIDMSYISEILKNYNRIIRKKDDYCCYCGTIAHPFLRFDIPVRSIRNHTVESLSGVHHLTCEMLGNLHKWMSSKCIKTIRDIIDPHKNVTVDNENTYEEIQ